jgi:hypothetical protein
VRDVCVESNHSSSPSALIVATIRLLWGGYLKEYGKRLGDEGGQTSYIMTMRPVEVRGTLEGPLLSADFSPPGSGRKPFCPGWVLIDVTLIENKGSPQPFKVGFLFYGRFSLLA